MARRVNRLSPGRYTWTMPAAAPRNIFEQDLPKNPANYAPLTPLSFLERAACVYPDRVAVIHGALRYTWREVYARCRRLGSALSRRGIGVGHTVAAIHRSSTAGPVRSTLATGMAGTTARLPSKGGSFATSIGGGSLGGVGTIAASLPGRPCFATVSGAAAAGGG